MNAVSAIVSRVDKISVRWAADDLIEVEDAVESRLRADPIVDLIADLRLRIVPAGIVRNRSDVVPRNDRGANHLNALRFEAGREFSHSGHQLLGADIPTNVVRTHEQNDGTDAGMRQHIAIQALAAPPAGCARPQTRAT